MVSSHSVSRRNVTHGVPNQYASRWSPPESVKTMSAARASERLSSDDLIHERYRGIRPAFGYPACPDHSEKTKLFALVGAHRAGLALTESCAMTPAASVSGLYFAHPQAKYFNVGRIGPDQLKSWAERNASSVDAAERALAPLL